MPSSAGHRTPGSRAHPPDPAWRDWDRAWTTAVRAITGHPDISVVVAKGAGGGAAACFDPQLRRVEIDAAHIGDPSIANPHRAGHKRAVPVAYGLLLHEAAHAVHSLWTAPPGTPPVITEAAELLEEARAESRHRTRRPRDRQYLRATVTALVHPGDAPADDPWHAGRAAALLLARADARILTATDVRGIRGTVTTILGRARLRQLRDVWRQALTTTDDDTATMIGLGWRWCRILGIDPDREPNVPGPGPGQFPGRLAAAIAAWGATAAGLSTTDYLAATAGGRTAPLTRATRTGTHPLPATWPVREPTPGERAAARTLAAALAAARATDPEPGRAASAVPPGRLRTRQAITAQAQTAAGQLPTAAQFQRRAPQPPDKPPVRLAVLVDISGSMGAYRAPMSAAAWIFAHAAAGNHTTTATIAFGSHTTLLTRPGQRPAEVREMTTGGGTDTFIPAIHLADQLLHLRQPGPIRIAAIVSDGDLADTSTAQQLITTLHREGVTILWLRPADLPGHTFDDTTTLHITDPATAITAIADAMTSALARA